MIATSIKRTFALIMVSCVFGVQAADSQVCQQARALTDKQAVESVRTKHSKCGLDDFFLQAVEKEFEDGKSAVIQIGAHTGFEKNDPLWKLLLNTFQGASERAQKWTWLMVEPVPTNIDALKKNVKRMNLPNGGRVIICQAAVSTTALSGDGPQALTFYSISDAIDPKTGYDRITQKKLPSWVTQIGSFDRKHILRHSKTWRRKGLNVNKYIKPIRVRVKTIESILIENQVNVRDVAVILLDTEGYDCRILLSQNFDSNGLRPKILVYEYKWCTARARHDVHEHLGKFGYAVYQEDDENDVAVLQIT